MLSFRYINVNRQPTYTAATLLIEDLDLPSVDPVRIEKVFKQDAQTLDADFFHSEARKEIMRIVAEGGLVPPAQPTEGAVDGDLSE